MGRYYSPHINIFKKGRIKRMNKITCKCGRSIKMAAPDLSGKRHGHCQTCKREWHMTSSGKIYAHPYKPRQ